MRCSETFLRLPFPVACLHTDGMIGAANAAMGELMRLAPESLAGRAFADLAECAQRPAVQLAVDSAAKGESARASCHLVRADGARNWVALSIAPAEDGLLVLLSDLSDQMSAEEDLRWRERQFRAVSENAADIISRFDLELRYVYVNPAIQRVTGLPPSAYIGRSVVETAGSPEMRAFWTRHLTEAFRGGREVTADF